VLINPRSKTVFGYTIYAIIGTVLELTVLLVILLWVLPLFDIYIPWWIVAILLVIELGFSAFTYIMGRRALSQRLVYGPEAIIGSEGVVATALDPTGYVKIRGELWKAYCQSKLNIGDEVVVVEMKGLSLIVIPKRNGSTRLPSE
jgi:membrane protein implicated in regulation of membrane protease activity